jgi:dihydrodipicolinate reductase
MTNIILIGCNGKMGKMVSECVKNDDEAERVTDILRAIIAA